MNAGSAPGAIAGRQAAAQRPHILIVAWLIGPGRGSEWSAAWGMALVAAELGDVTVLCRPDCVDLVRGWCARNPRPAIEAVAVEPRPGWRQRLAPRVFMGHFLDYLAWLEAVPAAAATVRRRRPIDLAVHAALGCYWLPSPVVDLGVPAVWGSVGGGMPVPLGLLPILGPAGMVERAAERLTIALAAALPATRRTMRRASVVLADNAVVRDKLPDDVAARTLIFQRALLTDVPEVPAAPPRRAPHVLFPSLLTARKGALLAVEAFAAVPEPYRLIFANAGPDEERARRRAAALGLAGRVEFRGRVPRDEYLVLTRSAAAALFVGLNEDGGCALCEAMLLGTPVAVLAHGGPREIVELWGTDPTRVAAVPPAGGGAATAQALAAGITALLARAPARSDPYLDRDGAIAALKRAYALALTARRLAPPRDIVPPAIAATLAAGGGTSIEGAKAP